MAAKVPTGMLIDGCFASEAIDSSGEIVSVEGMDVSTMEEGYGVANYEHRDDGGNGAEIVGKIVYVHKVLKAADCENDRQRAYWKQIKGIPFLYGVVRLYDGAGHAGAQALAAQIRDHAANDEPILVRYSIEGTTVERDGNHIKQSLAKRVALTLKPCNRTCVSGVVADPHAPAGFAVVEKAENAFTDPQYRKLGAVLELECHPMVYDDPVEAVHPLLARAIVVAGVVRGIKKALTAGNYDAAPSTLTGGAALQREDDQLRRQRNLALAALRDYPDRFSPDGFRKFVKARLPEVSDDFLDHFTTIAEHYHLKRRDLRKKVEDVPSLRRPKIGRPSKAEKPLLEDVPDHLEDAPDEVIPAGGGAHRALQAGTVRGQPLAPNPQLVRPEFDEAAGVLHTPIGSFRAHLPQRDGWGQGHNYQKILASPEIEGAMDHAMENWAKVHRLNKAGQLPPEVAMHAVMFAQLSPNKPVPVQEIQYCLDQDTILPVCYKEQKAIKCFRAGDQIWGVNHQGEVVPTTVAALHSQGVVNGYEVTFDDGFVVVASSRHKFLTTEGMVALEEVVARRLGVLCEPACPSCGVGDSLRSGASHAGAVEGAPQGLQHLQGAVGDSSLFPGEGTGAGEPSAVAGRAAERVGSLGRAEEDKPAPQHGRDSALGKGEARRVCSSAGQSCSRHAPLAGGAPGGVYPAHLRNAASSEPGLANGEPRSLHGQCNEVGRVGSSVASIQPGSLPVDYAEIHRGWPASQLGSLPDRAVGSDDAEGLVAGADQVWGAHEGGGPRQARPQGLDRGGRGSPLSSTESVGTVGVQAGQGPGAGRDAKRRGVASEGRDADTVGHGVLLRAVQAAEGGVGGLAFKDAPLASTRGLVLRHVVRVRAVGPRRMYDLEVAHPKHNFLLLNGVVTSNSRLVDAMKATGIDPRKPGFETIDQHWLAQDRPDVLPETGRDAFRSNPAYYQGGQVGPQYDAAGARVGKPSPATGRIAGDLLSTQPLRNDFLGRAAQYHKLHDGIMDLVRRHRHDGLSAVTELMDQKSAAANWHNRRRAAVSRGAPDPGPFQGVTVPGLKVKTGLYTWGMMGGGNSVVPDTHFIRNMYGLDLKKDADTIEYLKNLHWRPTNMHVMRGFNNWYAAHHPAVEYTANHPKWKHLFQDRRDALFPAFWRHWLTIAPSERALGMPNKAQQAATTHAPYWDAIAPHVDEALQRLGKADVDSSVPLRTALVHQQYVRDYGEVPAMMMYYRFLVPKLLEAAQHREGQGRDMRFLAKAREVEHQVVELRKTVREVLEGRHHGLPDVYRVSLSVGGGIHPAARFMVHDGRIKHLEDYHGVLAHLLPQGPVDDKAISRLHGLRFAPHLLVNEHPVPDRPPQEGNGGEVDHPEVQVADDPLPPPPPVFEYVRPGLVRPHVVEFGAAGAALDGRALADEELQLMLENVQGGIATLRYRGAEHALIKAEEPDPGGEDLSPAEVMFHIRQAVKAGTLHPSVERSATRHYYEDPMVPGVGNKYAWEEFAAKARPGVYVSMDGNDMKAMNDTHGHHAGDAAIRGMGGALQRAGAKLRGEGATGAGKIFRTGGDEFVGHFPTYEAAATFMRHATTHMNEVPPIEGTHQLSMSFGVGHDYRTADRALYHAKAAKVDPASGMRAFPAGRTPHLAHSLLPGQEGPIPLHAEAPPLQHLPAAPAAKPA